MIVWKSDVHDANQLNSQYKNFKFEGEEPGWQWNEVAIRLRAKQLNSKNLSTLLSIEKINNKMKLFFFVIWTENTWIKKKVVSIIFIPADV